MVKNPIERDIKNVSIGKAIIAATPNPAMAPPKGDGRNATTNPRVIAIIIPMINISIAKIVADIKV